MQREWITSARMLIALTLLTGVIYPLVMTGVSRAVFPEASGGSMVYLNGQLRGSKLIGQDFHSTRYFWPRPSATGYSFLPSGASNLSPTSSVLAAQVATRRAMLDSANQGQTIPATLLYASGSGLDPHISPEAAFYQIDRVATARRLDPARVRSLVDRYIEPRTFGFLGEPRVNVLLLNLALDSLGH